MSPPKPPVVLLLCGPSLMGKTHMVERVLALEYDVATERADGLYNQSATAVGIGGQGVPKTHKALRDGSLDEETIAAFYKAHDGFIERIFRIAKRYRVTPVLEGFTLMFEPEVRSVERAARVAYGDTVRVVRAFVHAPYPQWAANMISRADERKRTELPIAAMRRSQWEKRVVPPAHLDGIEEHTIQDLDELHALVANLGVQRHKWYQGFEIGPVKVEAMTDAHQKVAAIAPEDIIGKTVIDMCCATGVTGMIMRQQGAALVTAIESHPGRVGKAHEIVKVLRRHADFPRDGVKILMGDAFALIESLQADTVVLLGALHYFGDYEEILTKIACPAMSALYVEVLLTDRGKGMMFMDDDAPYALSSFERKNGATIYAPDTPTFSRLVQKAIPEFELVSRVPSQGLGQKGPDTYREVWGFKRNGPSSALVEHGRDAEASHLGR